MRAKPKCSLAIKHTTVLDSTWIGCKEVVGECRWIQEHNKCPKQAGDHHE